MDVRRVENYLDRRQFVRLLAATGLGAALASCGGAGPTADRQPVQDVSPTAGGQAGLAVASPTADRQPAREVSPTAGGQANLATASPTADRQPVREASPTAGGQAYLAVARGDDPRAITRAALAAIGGMDRFVKSGDDVIVKPNICVDYRSYEYGATTNPQVVAALVEMCLGAGARRVRVMDSPFAGSPETAYATSGIAEAVEAAGGEMEIMNPAKFRTVEIPDGRDIKSWSVYQDVLTADVLIDVPVAKHHSLARLSLGGKNLMGVVDSRNMIHANLGQRIADLASLLRPTLTVEDAVRTLMAHGPTGGNLSDVRLANTVVASHDMVAADAYAATLFDLTGEEIAYVKAAADMGLGTLDLGAIEIEEVSV